jgi:adenosylhomocysteine nucleosidase
LYDDIRIAVVECGTGQSRAARATQALLDAHKPKWVISTGFAGALRAEIKIGHILVADRVMGANGEELTIDVGMPADAARGLHVGRLLTVDHMVRTIAEKQTLAEKTDSLAVDMESFAVATVCRRSKTRFMAVRAISDDLSADLPPEVLSLVGETGAVRFGAVIGSLIKRPSSIKDMWRLREQAAVAADRLADFLDGIVSQLHRAKS